MSYESARLAAMLSVMGDESGDVVDWDTVEEFYGVSFPSDYKEFVFRFGGGTIEGSFGILVPVATDDSMVRRVYRLPDPVRADLDVNRWAGVEGPTPRLEDVLIWGDTESADFVGWLTVGEDPESWPLAAYSRDSAAWSIHDMGMTEFLVGILMDGFGEYPISDRSLAGIGQARFLHDREEDRMIEMGIYPWGE